MSCLCAIMILVLSCSCCIRCLLDEGFVGYRSTIVCILFHPSYLYFSSILSFYDMECKLSLQKKKTLRVRDVEINAQLLSGKANS